MKLLKYILCFLAMFICITIQAEDELELDTTFIKGNKELPQMMYVVPWQDMKSVKNQKANQSLVLHSLFGNIFDPVLPDSAFLSSSTETASQPASK